jgi:hypothetical protein
MDLPREEMAFRKAYETLVTEQQLTTVFRPGNRLYPNYRGYKPEERLVARIIEKVGSDANLIPPLFNEIQLPIRITKIHIIDINNLMASHFDGSSPDVKTIEDLICHLESIYQRPLSDYGNEVTRIQIKYLDYTANRVSGKRCAQWNPLA